MFKKFFIFSWEIIKVAAISLAIIIPVRYFLIQPFYVKGSSMETSFQDHEYLIIDEISYRFRPIIRGEVVVFRYPLDPREYFIKRVIGLPGESIQIKNSQVIIYNQENPSGLVLRENYLAAGTPTYANSDDKIEIGPDEYYVLGDNRTASQDSRSFGPVNKSFITGYVFLRGWPFTRAAIFNKPVDYSMSSN